MQLSKLEKAALKDIALDEESNELETLIKDKCKLPVIQTRSSTLKLASGTATKP